MRTAFVWACGSAREQNSRCEDNNILHIAILKEGLKSVGVRVMRSEGDTSNVYALEARLHSFCEAENMMWRSWREKIRTTCQEGFAVYKNMVIPHKYVLIFT